MKNEIGLCFGANITGGEGGTNTNVRCMRIPGMDSHYNLVAINQKGVVINPSPIAVIEDCVSDGAVVYSENRPKKRYLLYRGDSFEFHYGGQEYMIIGTDKEGIVFNGREPNY
jgi:hypothetical protein